MDKTELKYIFNEGSKISYLVAEDWVLRFQEKYGISGKRKLDDVLEEKVLPLLEFCNDASLFCRLKGLKRFYVYYSELEKILYESFIEKKLF